MHLVKSTSLPNIGRLLICAHTSLHLGLQHGQVRLSFHGAGDATAGTGHLAPRGPGRDDQGCGVRHQVDVGDVRLGGDVVREGYRHIDCAYCYGNEKQIGDVLREMVGEDKFVRRWVMGGALNYCCGIIELPSEWLILMSDKSYLVWESWYLDTSH